MRCSLTRSVSVIKCLDSYGDQSSTDGAHQIASRSSLPMAHLCSRDSDAEVYRPKSVQIYEYADFVGCPSKPVNFETPCRPRLSFSIPPEIAMPLPPGRKRHRSFARIAAAWCPWSCYCAGRLCRCPSHLRGVTFSTENRRRRRSRTRQETLPISRTVLLGIASNAPARENLRPGVAFAVHAPAVAERCLMPST
jgi:hypothetical protein